jgi:indole-3-glycerol phosphate synthase
VNRPATYLDRILLQHREVAAKDERDLNQLVERCLAMAQARGFRQRVLDDAETGISVISEIKRRSPSKGDLAEGLDPEVLAVAYESGGASCLSVLTDEDFFGGSILDLQRASSACSLPVLRKDFTVSRHDVCDARLMGADCVLLIAAALSEDELQIFHELAVSIGLDVLVEIHDEKELELALQAKATLIGVNQRDLVTFQVDHERALRMANQIPAGVARVAESGVRNAQDAAELHDAGYHAILVGESLVTSPDPSEAVRLLRAASQ